MIQRSKTIFASVISENKKYCVVDGGNTQVKIVDFCNEEVVQQLIISNHDLEGIRKTLVERKNVTSILSTVLKKEDQQWLESLLEPNVVLSKETSLPISIEDYRTPLTLGADRIANAVAANHYAQTENALVIDIGTCITFDLVTKGRYQGGSISPGYRMRLKAMHHYTGALPNIPLDKFDDFVGKSTDEAMLSGVNRGIQAEISGFIDFYTRKYDSLTIFLTGGDHKRFDMELKNSIFADNNFTIKGLYIILKHNV